MANLLASRRSSATTPESLQRSVGTIQNNVSNASTPGYVRQRMSLSALDFDPENGLSGGIGTGGLASARDLYAEAAVRWQTSVLGSAQGSRTLLSSVESALSLNDTSGIPRALDRFYAAASSWNLAPSSVAEQENVLAAANDLATAFNRTAEALQRAGTEAETQIRTTISAIDATAERIRLHNVERAQGRAADAGSDARLHADLEELSGLINVQALWHADGSVSVLAGGRSAIVAGTQRTPLTSSFSSLEATYADPTAAAAKILDGDGNDITSWLTGGTTGALLGFLNKTLPGYTGGASGPGGLNVLAKTVASRVNTLLSAAYPPPGAPQKLFIHDSSDVAVAGTIRLNPAMTPALLEAADQTQTPSVANGVPQKLAALARPSQAEDMLDGVSYVSYFGRLSARAGRDLAEAKKEIDSRQQLVAQARSLRDQVSAVSLDEEAIRLVEFQRAYQATARMVSALNEITEMAVNLGRG